MARTRTAQLILILLSCLALQAASLDELRDLETLTPKTFASYFTDFDFELNEQVQSPETFLARRKGDCDDYATLAATLLAERGYHPRLIAVFLPKIVHVVCYIPETGSCLDFNLRHAHPGTFPSGPAIASIADRVAASFDQKWYCAAEFTFKNSQRQFLFTEFPSTDTPALARARPTTHPTAKGGMLLRTPAR